VDRIPTGYNGGRHQGRPPVFLLVTQQEWKLGESEVLPTRIGDVALAPRVEPARDCRGGTGFAKESVSHLRVETIAVGSSSSRCCSLLLLLNSRARRGAQNQDGFHCI
jgi:hypothetical protein